MCLLAVCLDAKKTKTTKTTQQSFLGEKVTSVCSAPFYLYSGAAGGYLTVTAGSPPSLSYTAQNLLCLNSQNQIVSSDGTLILEVSMTGVVFFGQINACQTCSIPSFTLSEDSLKRIYFAVTSSTSLCTSGYDISSTIVIASYSDSRPRWFVENSNLVIQTTIPGVTIGTYNGGSGSGSGGSSGTSVCNNPFALFNVATGGYLQAVAGSAASLSASIQSMFCLSESSEITTADGTLVLQENAGASVLSFEAKNQNIYGVAPSFATKVDSSYHFQFLVQTAFTVLATAGWDQSSQIVLGGNNNDSRQLWFVENASGNIQKAI
jgi:hypothetical protein